MSEGDGRAMNLNTELGQWRGYPSEVVDTLRIELTDDFNERMDFHTVKAVETVRLSETRARMPIVSSKLTNLAKLANTPK